MQNYCEFEVALAHGCYYINVNVRKRNFGSPSRIDQLFLFLGDSLSWDLGSGGASSQSATDSTAIFGSRSDSRPDQKSTRDRGLEKDDAQENGPKRRRISDEENVDSQSPKKCSHREAVNSSHSRSPLRSLRWESSPLEEGGCDEENVQAGEDDEGDLSEDDLKGAEEEADEDGRSEEAEAAPIVIRHSTSQAVLEAKAHIKRSKNNDDDVSVDDILALSSTHDEDIQAGLQDGDYEPQAGLQDGDYEPTVFPIRKQLGSSKDNFLQDLLRQKFGIRIMFGDGSCFARGMEEHLRLMNVNVSHKRIRQMLVEWIRIEHAKGRHSAYSEKLHYTLEDSNGQVVIEDDGVLHRDVNGEEEILSLDEYCNRMDACGYFGCTEIHIVVDNISQLTGFHLSVGIVQPSNCGTVHHTMWIDPMMESGKRERQKKHVYFSLHNAHLCRHYNIITALSPGSPDQAAIPYEVKVNEAPPISTCPPTSNDLQGNVSDVTVPVPTPTKFRPHAVTHVLPDDTSELPEFSLALLQKFGVFWNNCETKLGIDMSGIRPFPPNVPKQNVKNGKNVSCALHYCPLTVGNFCSGGHASSEVNGNGDFISETWGVVCAALTPEAYEFVVKFNLIPFEFPYEGNPQDVFQSVDDYNKVMREYTRTFLQEAIELSDHTAFLSKCVGKKAKQLLGSAFFDEHLASGKLVSLSKDEVQPPAHPEQFTNEEFRNGYFKGHCLDADKFYTKLRKIIIPNIGPCTVFVALYNQESSNLIFRMMEANAARERADWDAWRNGHLDIISEQGWHRIICLLGWAMKATPEQLRERARKRVETMGPDRLSAAALQRVKTMGPDRLSEAARKGAPKRVETMGPDRLSAAALQRVKTMGPDRLSEAARKNHARKDEKGRSLSGRKSSATQIANNPLYRELTKTTPKGTTQEKKLGEDSEVLRCNWCERWAMDAVKPKIYRFKDHLKVCKGKKCR
eukprot:scaffold1268_cov133-Skeletonema_marinoi.AAC.4